VLLPGEPESKMNTKRLKEGIPIPKDTWQAVRDAGLTVGVDIDTIKAV
jgi:LDH2 family malate/lactate/ureidoglycolate dehydrogenase